MLRNTPPTNEEEPLLKWRGFEDIFGWSEEKLEEEQQRILKAPRYYEQILSYIGRPAEAVKAGIKARIEEKGVLPALKGGLMGEEETKGRDILDALGIPLDDPDWILNHPVQHFLVEMGGAGLEFVTDPIIWALWFAPGTKLLKGAQKYLARKEITKFAKTLKTDLSGVAAPGARKVLLEELKVSPRYGKYLTKPWFRELTKHFRKPKYVKYVPEPWKPTAVYRRLVLEPSDYLSFFSGLPEVSPVALELTTKTTKTLLLGIAKLRSQIKGAGYKVSPSVATEWKATLGELTKRKVKSEGRPIAEYYREVSSKIEIAPEVPPKAEVPYPTAKEVVDELSTKIRTTQNTDIEEAILTTGIPPDSLKQGLYVYNHTGESITEPDKRIKAFEKLLEKNNPVAYKALSTGVPQISIEEVSLKMTTLDKEVARLNREADTEFNSVRDFIYKEAFPEEVKSILGRVKEHGGIKYSSAMKDYPEEWKQMPLSAKNKEGLPVDEMADELKMDIEDLVERLAQYKARPKPSDFDNETYELIERNLGDFPNYMKRMELLDQRDRYQSALLELRTRQPAPSPETVVDQTEVKIEPSPKLEEEKMTPLVEKPEEEEVINWITEEERARIIATEQMKLKFGDIISEKTTRPPWEMGPPIKGTQLFLDVIPPEDIPVDIEPWPTSNKDVHFLGRFRRNDRLFGDYERATGIPIASQGFYGIRDASVMMRREEITLRGTLAQILRGISKDRRIAIGKVMEGKELELSDRETDALEAMRNFYKFLGKEFGLAEEEMIENYLPRIMKFMRTGDPSGLPAEMEAWFKKHRIGELRWKKEDPLEITRIYIHAGLRDKYLYESRLIPDFVKHIQDLPFGIKSKARDWLAHRILRHPTRWDVEVAGSLAKIPGYKQLLDRWGVDSTTALRQITRAVTQVFYAGGIGFKVMSAGKNVTQQTHNIAIWGLKYWVKGLFNAPRKDTRELADALNILRKYGAELERRGIDNPASIPQKVVDAGNFIFRKADGGSRLTGLGAHKELVPDMYKLYQQGKITKQQFLRRTKFDLVPFGRRPELIELFNKGDIEGYMKLSAKELIKLGQFTYEPEDMPLIFSGSLGRVASVFMTWPIEFAEMQGQFVQSRRWETILYYYLAAMAVQNGLRYAGIETNPYGYGDVKIGNHRISLIPGGWFLLGSAPTGFSPALQILYTGGRVVAVHGKGASDRFLAELRADLKRASKILIPFGLAGSDIIQAIEEIQSGTYGKRDKNGRLIYVSDESEVILRGLGFTTVEEAERRYREPIYEFGEEERKLGKPTPLRREAPSWWETH